ncbi:MAG: hypothetical protein JW807_06920 [Spirochaetes bacterium]|nr:hypothetical protein [Spirochaetota bacterium]
MRIEPSNTIRILSKSGMSDQLRGIQKGAEIAARIIERIGGKEAVLEIAGRRVNAEFLRGLPAGNTVTLQLEGRQANSYLFKLVDRPGTDALARQLLDLTVFNRNEIQKNLFHNLGAALGKHPAGIFELNALLLGLYPKEEKKDDDLNRLLGHLRKLGLGAKTIADLSILLSGRSIDTNAFRSVLMLLGFDENRAKKWTSGTERDIEEMVGDIIDEIESLDDVQQKADIISRLIGILKDHGANETGHTSGEFAWSVDEDILPVRYAGREHNWIFSVDFSALGRIDILARETERNYAISIFCDSGEIIAALNQSREQLERGLRAAHSAVQINFYNTRQAINKMVEIYSYSSLNSVFDIRV